MKTTFIAIVTFITLVAYLIPTFAFAQTEKEDDKDAIISYGKPYFFRPYDKRGLHMFETTKEDQYKPYNGMRLNIGAGFTQQLQTIKQENPGALNNELIGAGSNKLFPLQSGFMTAQANLYIDVQLADGIQLNLSNYLSSRHHNEFWVKGGYIQFDKLPFDGDFWDQLMEIATIKVGHMEINYGDAHFRRPDGGQTLYSPFMEGNIMDAFATEIGGEIYLKKNGFFGMLGLTNGMIKGYVDSTYATDMDDNTKRRPSIYLKGGVDKQMNEDIRVRLTGSFYHNSGTAGSGLTLYSGDRTGSNYQNVMEQYYTAAGVAKAYTAMQASGRFNPGFTAKLDAFMINGFTKVKGFEFFGTYEYAKGRNRNEAENRVANQYAIEGIYRFGKNENLYGGLRYNAVTAELTNYTEKVKVNRFAVAAGWFLTKNVLLKGEYVNQQYNDFPNTDYRHNGKFNGLVIEAVVGF